MIKNLLKVLKYYLVGEKFLLLFWPVMSAIAIGMLFVDYFSFFSSLEKGIIGSVFSHSGLLGMAIIVFLGFSIDITSCFPKLLNLGLKSKEPTLF